MKYTMSDGRVFTDYTPNCQLNQTLQEKYKTVDAHAYRHYLQQNAQKVIDDTKVSVADCLLCPVCEASLAYKPRADII